VKIINCLIKGVKMRIRNVKNAKEIINNSGLVVKTNPFNNERELRIEIGMGKGNFIINMAKANPNINFIGIEKYESILAKAIKKIDDIPNNLRFMCLDAKEINNFFNHNVSLIYLNFSDPWPKKRHAKRRLTSPDFLDKYEDISKRRVHIIQKTDNKLLFAYSLITLNNKNYTFNNLNLDLNNSDIPNIKTEYEDKFIKEGITINYLDATKDI
jgi:tRNA (guanine-N7-)-methyltransferase